MKVALAILNYNGRHHLAELLPTAIAAVKFYGKPCPIIVLDNQSPSDDVAWIQSYFPSVEVIVSPKNDFLFSYNWLLAKREEDVVILLNNDLRLSENFIPCLIRHFSNPTTFAVSCKAFSWDGNTINSGPCNFAVKRGRLLGEFQMDRQYTAYTLFSSGGFMAVDRRKFLELGGFDRLFYPAYGEDKDLCFRAWSKGMKCIYEPGCHVYHREGGSWDQEANRSRRLIDITNYLFMWRNFRFLRFQIPHHLYLAWLSVRKRIEGDTGWLETLKEARQLWCERRKGALTQAPCAVDLDLLEKKCGAPICEET